MAKVKVVYFCKNCGAEYPKWEGQCRECGEWNTLVEEKVIAAPKSRAIKSNESENIPTLVSKVSSSAIMRQPTCFEELNRVLGGGVVPGSLILLGGEPGIGKSTLSLQIALHSSGFKSLYVSGEESLQQIKLRADRLGISNDNCTIYTETLLENILKELGRGDYDLVVIDSIQTISSDRIDAITGGVSQIRECAALLLKFAKESMVPVFIIGHITKDGSIAGPKILEHIVDVVLQFEGDTNNTYRIIRGIKNRFGATNELGVFEMAYEGLKEVSNPSEMLLTGYEDSLSGIAVGAMIEGGRAYMLEVQALVSPVAFGTPQRVTTGFDQRRLNMLLAVVEKRLGYKMVAKDTFINIAGGLRVNDTGLDMAVIASILSSLLDISIPNSVCFCGEVGLSGEVRPATRTEQRVMEAKRLGFARIVCSTYAKTETMQSITGIKISYVSRVEQLVKDVIAKL